MSKENGRFEKGNEIGKETRFEMGNTASSKYKEKYAKMLLEYFAEPKCDVHYERTFYKDGKIKSERPIVMPPKFPTFELFATSIGVNSRTLRNWVNVHPRFAEAYECAKTMQLGIAKVYGMSKMYDSNFAKFILINDHDMKDKVSTEFEGDEAFEVNINVIES